MGQTPTFDPADIADLAYVDHQSGNQNFECLQGIARDAIRAASDD